MPSPGLRQRVAHGGGRLAGPAHRGSGGAVASSLWPAQVSDAALGQITGRHAQLRAQPHVAAVTLEQTISPP